MEYTIKRYEEKQAKMREEAGLVKNSEGEI